MNGTQVLIPIDADLFWQQLREIVGQVIDERNRTQGSPDKLSPAELLKVKDVCKLFQISKPTIYEWIRKGQLKSMKIESRRFFLRKDIELMLSGHLHDLKSS